MSKPPVFRLEWKSPQAKRFYPVPHYLAHSYQEAAERASALRKGLRMMVRVVFPENQQATVSG